MINIEEHLKVVYDPEHGYYKTVRDKNLLIEKLDLDFLEQIQYHYDVQNQSYCFLTPPLQIHTKEVYEYLLRHILKLYPKIKPYPKEQILTTMRQNTEKTIKTLIILEKLTPEELRKVDLYLTTKIVTGNKEPHTPPDNNNGQCKRIRRIKIPHSRNRTSPPYIETTTERQR